MDIEFKRTNNRNLGKIGLYTALVLCLTAAGIGTYAAMRKATPPTGDQTQRYTQNNHGATVEADIPATGITISIRPTETTTEPTTKEESTTPDNLPFTGSFSLPLGTEILKDYSNGEMMQSKTMGDWRIHNGIDFSGKEGAEVSAVQRGTVRNVYDDPMWGLTVEVDHGNTMVAKYCGLKGGTTPKKGDTVARGAKIGELAQIPIEQADGFHLHFEVTVNDTVVDPLAAINRAD